jgi:O-antigen/teichoic acid export membrane protein
MSNQSKPRPGELADDPETGGSTTTSQAASRRMALRSRALAGVALVTSRDVAVKVMGLVGSIAFARLLTPSQFGLVAFGLTLVTFVQLFSDGGLGAGLIRRAEAPEEDDLRALLGFQLGASLVLAAACAALALALSSDGWVTAVMMAALPVLVLRTPSMIVLERDLAYAPLVKVEIGEQLAYYSWGIVTVALTGGVWGLATATVVKALVGTAILFRVSPVARLRPTFSLRRLRPMLAFGAQFQAVQLTNAGGAQLLNVGVAAVAGLETLGLWTMAWRLLSAPFLLFGALWRVSYPAAARLMDAGESGRHMIERGADLAAVGTGLILAPATAALPALIPIVFGEQWGPVADILPPVFFALQVSGPVSVSTAGYLYAMGDTATVLVAALVAAVLWIVVALPLLAPLGPVALGLGGMAAALSEAAILSRAAWRHCRASLARPVLMPWIAATVAGLIGWLLSLALGQGLAGAAAGGFAALGVYVGVVALLRREVVATIARLVRTSVSPTSTAVEH